MCREMSLGAARMLCKMNEGIASMRMSMCLVRCLRVVARIIVVCCTAAQAEHAFVPGSAFTSLQARAANFNLMNPRDSRFTS